MVPIRRVLLIGVAVLGGPAESLSQERPVEVLPSVQVSADLPGVPHVEPHLAVNPKDPEHLVAASMVAEPDRDRIGLAVFVSRDAGQSWVRQRLPTAPANTTVADPWVAIGDSGYVFVGVLTRVPEAGVVGDVYRSTDGGLTWEDPVRLPAGGGASYDHLVLATNLMAGAHRGDVYAAGSQGTARRGVYSISVLRSTNRGSSFQGPHAILPNNFNNQNGNMIVLPDGTLMVSFFEISAAGERLRYPRLWIATSTDGAETFSPPTLVREAYPFSWPILAVDRGSGPNAGRVYAAWVDRDAFGTSETPDETSISVVHSDDQGQTWSDAVRFSPSETRKGNVMLAVSTDGSVGLTWPDWEEGEGSCSRLVFSWSSDGGETFSAPVPVGPVSCSETSANLVAVADTPPVGLRYPDGGDYHGLASGGHGVFHAFWSDSRSGVLQLWSASIRTPPRLR